jgi:propionate CoA-transferase
VRFLTAEEAAALIPDGATIGNGGFTMTGVAEELIAAIEQRFLQTGHPRDLTLVHSAGQSDGRRGMPHWANDGLLRRLIGSHWGLAPRMAEFIAQDRVAAYCFPQGQIAHLFRAIANGGPGVITHVGLKTFVDPRLGGGKITPRSQRDEDLVELVRLGGREYLWYKAFPIQVGIIRGTTADAGGNISNEEEGILHEILSIAQAARSSGGMVIAQVKRRVAAGALHPKQVRVPGFLVDVVVVARDPAEGHPQTASAEFNPGYSGDQRVPVASLPPLPMSERKIIGRRAAMELRPGAIINLGTGIPGDTIGPVAAEEGILDQLQLTIESGTIGGVPAGGTDFGIALNPTAILEHASQFDFYDGGGVDQTFMGFGQVDRAGNVNASQFGTRTVGCGGFIDLTQNAKRVVFCGTFTSGGLRIAVDGGVLRILGEGAHAKFVESVSQVTFSAEFARHRRQPVRYVTERAVFELGAQGIRLIEIAPGIDVRRDLLRQLPFRPEVAEPLGTMPAAIFRPDPMGLAQDFGSDKEART